MAKYFTEKEFNNCTPPCSLSDMDVEFMNILDAIREEAGIPLVINCAYRNSDYDTLKGRSGNSAHCYGLGVDIRCNDSTNRFKILKAAIKLGINRIGIGKTFVHIDISKDLPQNVLWHYYE